MRVDVLYLAYKYIAYCIAKFISIEAESSDCFNEMGYNPFFENH